MSDKDTERLDWVADHVSKIETDVKSKRGKQIVHIEYDSEPLWCSGRGRTIVQAFRDAVDRAMK